MSNFTPVFPHLRPQEVKVFIADDSSSKVEKMVESLGSVGLAHFVEIVATLEEAEEYIERQKPGAMVSNVYLLDGNLDPGRPDYFGNGCDLASLLFDKYWPMSGNNQRSAVELLQKEILIAGVSRDSKGEIPFVAQHPWIPHYKVGPIIYRSVVAES